MNQDTVLLLVANGWDVCKSVEVPIGNLGNYLNAGDSMGLISLEGSSLEDITVKELTQDGARSLQAQDLVISKGTHSLPNGNSIGQNSLFLYSPSAQFQSSDKSGVFENSLALTSSNVIKGGQLKINLVLGRKKLYTSTPYAEIEVEIGKGVLINYLKKYKSKQDAIEQLYYEIALRLGCANEHSGFRNGYSLFHFDLAKAQTKVTMEDGMILVNTGILEGKFSSPNIHKFFGDIPHIKELKEGDYPYDPIVMGNSYKTVKFGIPKGEVLSLVEHIRRLHNP